MLFKNKKTNTYEKVTNPIVIEQYEKRPDVYEEVKSIKKNDDKKPKKSRKKADKK